MHWLYNGANQSITLWLKMVYMRVYILFHTEKFNNQKKRNGRHEDVFPFRHRNNVAICSGSKITYLLISDLHLFSFSSFFSNRWWNHSHQRTQSGGPFACRCRPDVPRSATWGYKYNVGKKIAQRSEWTLRYGPAAQRIDPDALRATRSRQLIGKISCKLPWPLFSFSSPLFNRWISFCFFFKK